MGGGNNGPPSDLYLLVSTPCSDTICDLGGSQELANYGEYSGAPSESQTFEYAKTILGLMTKGKKHPQGVIGMFSEGSVHDPGT